MFLKLGRLLLGVKTNFKPCYSFSTSFKMSTGENIGVPLSKVTAVLEYYAPECLSESWDNTGLLVEPYTPRNITKILLTNDLTEDVALEASTQGCEMIISYHPPIFVPLKSIIQSAWKQRVVSLLLENRIALYSPHTSWDCIKGGVNDWLSSAFPVAISKSITPKEKNDPTVGAGRLLELEENITLSTAVNNVKKLTGLQYVRLAIGKGQTTSDQIQTVALCAGSGGSVLKGVVADLYVTGEMLHHDILDATQEGTSVILTNHSDSERGFLRVFSSELQKRLENQVKILVSNCDRDPLITL